MPHTLLHSILHTPDTHLHKQRSDAHGRYSIPDTPDTRLPHQLPHKDPHGGEDPVVEVGAGEQVSGQAQEGHLWGGGL